MLLYVLCNSIFVSNIDIPIHYTTMGVWIFQPLLILVFMKKLQAFT